MNTKRVLLIILFVIIAACAQTLLTIYKPSGVRGFILYMIIFVPLIWGAGQFYSKSK